MSFYIRDYDYERHNEEITRVWDAFHSGKPTRPPVIVGINPRFTILTRGLNQDRVTFEHYSADPDLMAAVQIKHQHYARQNILQDAEMGLPKDGWRIYVDFQNYYEAAWFGAPVHFREGQVPDTTPILADDNKRMLLDRGLPNPFKDGAMAENWRFYERMRANMGVYELAGLRVVDVAPCGLGTDGPFTVACNLRGATELCVDIYYDPEFVRELLSYIVEATITRILAFRKALGHEAKPASWMFADDSIQLLSAATYCEFVLPHHRRLLSSLASDGPQSVHLCGDVDRHMPVLKEELNIRTWDAGFPMDYARVRRVLGPDFWIQTGPRVSTLLHGTPDDVDAECRAILGSGITDGGRFVLREANNLSPRTPVENIAAMYAAAAKYGRYPAS